MSTRRTFGSFAAAVVDGLVLRLLGSRAGRDRVRRRRGDDVVVAEPAP